MGLLRDLIEVDADTPQLLHHGEVIRRRRVGGDEAVDNMPNMQTSQYVGMIKQRAIAAVDSLMKYHPNSSIVLTEHCGYANMKIYRPQYNAVNNANAELKAAYDILKVRYPNLR